MTFFSKIILPFLLLFAVGAHAQTVRHDQLKINTVVLDAGHGGNDPGTVYGSYREKDITLSVVLKVGEMIKKNHPGVNVVYTRKTDVFVPLSQRGIIANKAKGDLFISVHVNSAKNTSASGAETYTLGLHKSEANLSVAQKENSVITLEDNYEKEYGGFAPNDPESYIMLTLGQQGFLRESIELSHIIQENYKEHAGIKDRGIMQAGFLVLWRASGMPCVLTELGFLSNAEDRKMLTTKDGQEKLAKAVYNSFCDYKAKAEKAFQYTAASSVPEQPVSGYYENGIPKRSCYSVQLVSSKKRLDRTKRVFGDRYGEVFEVYDNNYYKYYVGTLDSYDEVMNLKQQFRKGKFRDAFDVGFHEGKIVRASELKKILKK